MRRDVCGCNPLMTRETELIRFPVFGQRILFPFLRQSFQTYQSEDCGLSQVKKKRKKFELKKKMALPVDSEVHELRLGKSFDSNSSVCFHSFRYDFKPASVDTSQEAKLEVGEGHQVTVTVPHVQGAGTSHTVFKGNKKPTVKECVLIIDHDTGTYTLEKLDQNVLLKKTRTEGSSKAHQPAAAADTKKASPSSKSKNSKGSPPSTHDSPSITPLPSDTDKGADDIALLGDLSSDSSDSDDEMMEVPECFQNGAQAAPSTSSVGNFLKDDLELSESGSDSD